MRRISRGTASILDESNSSFGCRDSTVEVHITLHTTLHRGSPILSNIIMVYHINQTLSLAVLHSFTFECLRLRSRLIEANS